MSDIILYDNRVRNLMDDKFTEMANIVIDGKCVNFEEYCTLTGRMAGLKLCADILDKTRKELLGPKSESKEQQKEEIHDREIY